MISGISKYMYGRMEKGLAYIEFICDGIVNQMTVVT